MGRTRWMLVAVLSALAFGMSGTFVKPVLDAGWSPGAGSIVRTGIGVLILAVPTIRALRGRWALVRQHWIGVLVLGGAGIAGTQTSYFLAVSRVPVSTALMIEGVAHQRPGPWGEALAAAARDRRRAARDGRPAARPRRRPRRRARPGRRGGGV